MPLENLPRRRFLRSSAAASGLVGASFAGCTDLMDDGGGDGDGSPGPDRDRPTYAAYVPSRGLFTGDGGETAFGDMYAFVDFEALAQYENLNVGGSATTPEDPVEGSKPGDAAFAAGPTVGLMVYVFGMFGLVGYSFTGDLMPSFGSDGAGDSNAALQSDLGVLTSFGYAFLGDYDVEALGERAEAFEAVDQREGFTVFEGPSGDDEDGFGFSMAEGLAFAASSDAVLIPLPDTGGDGSGSNDAERNRGMIDTMIDVVAGSAETAGDADGDVDWMLRTTGHGAFGIGTYCGGETLTGGGGVDDNFTGGGAGNESALFDQETRRALEDIGGILENAKLYGSSVELKNESDAVGHAVFGYPSSEDVPSDEAFEAVFGDVSGEFSLESGETRVYLTATQSLEMPSS